MYWEKGAAVGIVRSQTGEARKEKKNKRNKEHRETSPDNARGLDAHVSDSELPARGQESCPRGTSRSLILSCPQENNKQQ